MSHHHHGNAAHPPLDQEMATRLLDLLSEDDAFRELFAHDPEQALIQLGLSPEQAALALRGESCLRVTTALASKEALRAARERLMQSLTCAQPHTIVFAFND